MGIQQSNKEINPLFLFFSFLLLLLSCGNQSSQFELIELLVNNIFIDLEESNLLSDGNAFLVLSKPTLQKDSIILEIQYLKKNDLPKTSYKIGVHKKNDIWLTKEFDSNTNDLKMYGYNVPTITYKIDQQYNCGKMVNYLRYAPIPPGKPYNDLKLKVCIEEK